MTRVYYRGQLRYSGCYYYRCLLPLRACGWDGDYVTINENLKTPQEALKSIMASDIVVMHRPFEKASKDLFLALKEAGKKIIVDNDDTYSTMDTIQLGAMGEAMNNSINWFIKNADMVTCTTEFLANEYRKLNPNVFVLPNMINPTDFPKRQLNRTKKVRIGIVGSVGEKNTNDIEHIKPLIKELSEREDVTLVLFSGSTKDDFWKDIKCEWQPYVRMKDYFKTLAGLKLDIVLIPRKDNYFNRCKSNVKFLEMSVFGIPCVCQTWNDGESPYDNDGAYTTMANTIEDWRSAVNALIEDKEARKMFGTRSKKYVLANYDINKTKDLWRTLYAKLLTQ